MVWNSPIPNPFTNMCFQNNGQLFWTITNFGPVFSFVSVYVKKISKGLLILNGAFISFKYSSFPMSKSKASSLSKHLLTQTHQSALSPSNEYTFVRIFHLKKKNTHNNYMKMNYFMAPLDVLNLNDMSYSIIFPR